MEGMACLYPLLQLPSLNDLDSGAAWVGSYSQKSRLQDSRPIKLTCRSAWCLFVQSIEPFAAGLCGLQIVQG